MSVNSFISMLFDLPYLTALPEPVKRLLAQGVELLLLVLLYFVLRRLIARVVRRATEVVAAREEAAGNLGRAARVRTLASLARSVLFYVLGFLFLVALLGTLGFQNAFTTLVGTAGVAGLAVGFGAQKLVKDVITGFFILLEDQYAVGDYVTISGVTGTVEELGMRITRVRDDDGRLYIFSNGDIGQVCNQSRGPVAGVLEIAIAASADTAKAAEALNRAFDEAAMGLVEPARVEGIAAADAAKTVLRIRFRAAAGERPADLAPRLRETAHRALLTVEVPLA